MEGLEKTKVGMGSKLQMKRVQRCDNKNSTHGPCLGPASNNQFTKGCPGDKGHLNMYFPNEIRGILIIALGG